MSTVAVFTQARGQVVLLLSMGMLREWKSKTPVLKSLQIARMTLTAFGWTKGTHFICGIKLRTSGSYALVGPLVRGTHVVCVNACSRSICGGRSISCALRKGWDNPGFGTPWDMSNVGYSSLDLIPGGKSLSA